MKKLAFSLALALLIVFLSACQASVTPGDSDSSVQESTPPTDPITGYPSGYQCYGTDNGYDILFSGTGFFGSEIEVIAGEAFGYHERFELQAYKDGEMTLLKDAYAQGLVSKEAIAAARKYHNQRLENTVHSGMIADCCPAPIFRELQARIENAWLAKENESFGTWYNEENPKGDWRYYEGDILLCFGGEQEQTFTTIEIGGATFSHPTGFRIYYFARPDDILVDLLTEDPPLDITEELASAAQLHVECNNAVFGEDWDQ